MSDGEGMPTEREWLEQLDHHGELPAWQANFVRFIQEFQAAGEGATVRIIHGRRRSMLAIYDKHGNLYSPAAPPDPRGPLMRAADEAFARIRASLRKGDLP